MRRDTHEIRFEWDHDGPWEGGGLRICVAEEVLTRWQFEDREGDSVPLSREVLAAWWSTARGALLDEPGLPFQPADLVEVYAPGQRPIDLATTHLAIAIQVFDAYFDWALDEPGTTAREAEQFSHALYRWHQRHGLQHANPAAMIPPVYLYTVRGECWVEFTNTYDSDELWLAPNRRWRVDVGQVEAAFATLLVDAAPAPADGAGSAWYDREDRQRVEELVGVTDDSARGFWRRSAGQLTPRDLRTVVEAAADAAAAGPDQISAYRELSAQLRKEVSEGRHPWERGEKAAATIVAWDGSRGRALDERRVADRLGIQVREVEGLSEGIKGCCLRRGGELVPVVLLNRAHPDHEKPANVRFTLAHELFHALVDLAPGHGTAPGANLTVSSHMADAPSEQAANAFAAYSLLPRRLFRRLFNASDEALPLHEKLRSVAERAKVGLTLAVLNAGHYSLAPDQELREAAELLGVADLAQSFHANS